MIVDNLACVESATNNMMRDAIHMLIEIYTNEKIDDTVNLRHCSNYIEAIYGLEGIVLSEQNRRELTGRGTEKLSAGIVNFVQFCANGHRDSQSSASETAIHFLVDLVKMLKREATIFSSDPRAAEASISHAVGADLMAFMDHISKDKDRTSCPLAFGEPLCLDGIAPECMFHHLIKAYNIEFKGFPDFIEDIKSATSIKRAVSQVCLPPESPGGVVMMSMFGEAAPLP